MSKNIFWCRILFLLNSISLGNAQTAAPTRPPTPATTVIKLSGTIIGTSGSFQGGGDTIHKVFDGNINTFYDAASPGTNTWAGLDLGVGASFQITKIRYYPRSTFPTRMVNCKFQGSNSATFSTGNVNLYTIGSAPSVAWQTITVTNVNKFRYVRYLSAGQNWGNIAEAEFYGILEIPTTFLTSQPTYPPTFLPTAYPTIQPTSMPTGAPTDTPSLIPTGIPSICPSNSPTNLPTGYPSSMPTTHPSSSPSFQPTALPSSIPSVIPTAIPSYIPSSVPSTVPSGWPSAYPSSFPTNTPSSFPTYIPSSLPSSHPSPFPSSSPTLIPSDAPTSMPTALPSSLPSSYPTDSPSGVPSCVPSSIPSSMPTSLPSTQPTNAPTSLPTGMPTSFPSSTPSSLPSPLPSSTPTGEPSGLPSIVPSSMPSNLPTSIPSLFPTSSPSAFPTGIPSSTPTGVPSKFPTSQPSSHPTSHPSALPTTIPSRTPSNIPTSVPSALPTSLPSGQPSCIPSGNPTSIPTMTPSTRPTSRPTLSLTQFPTRNPTLPLPTSRPTYRPTASPTISLRPTTFNHDINLATLGSRGSAIYGSSILTQSNIGGSVLGLASDVNHDGLADVSVGVSSEGIVKPVIVLGVEDVMPDVDLSKTGNIAIPFSSASASASAGASDVSVVTSLGDINHDDIDDLMFTYSDALQGAGLVFVRYGPATVTLQNITYNQSATTSGFTISGSRSLDYLGKSACSVGDINGDDCPDFVIGAPQALVNEMEDAGAVYVIFCQSNTSNYRDIDLSIGLSPSFGVELHGSVAGGGLGTWVSGLGDINSDGLMDFAIGEPRSYLGDGVIYVMYGSSTITALGVGGKSSHLLQNLSLSRGFVITAGQAYDGVGLSFSGVGDINNDNHDDFIVSCSIAGTLSGVTFVIYGGGSNFESVVDLSQYASSSSTTWGYRIVSYDASLNSLVAAGHVDANKDGIDDIVICASSGGLSHLAYVVYGSSSSRVGDVDLSSMTVQSGLNIYNSLSAGYSADSARSCLATASVGDVDGDGYSDFALSTDDTRLQVYGGGHGSGDGIIPIIGAAYIITNIYGTDIKSPTKSPSTSRKPTKSPTIRPSRVPSQPPTALPSSIPSLKPSFTPTDIPSRIPSLTFRPSWTPSSRQTLAPTSVNDSTPVSTVTICPSLLSRASSFFPFSTDTAFPSIHNITISASPTNSTTFVPSGIPTAFPSRIPSPIPTRITFKPTKLPTFIPSPSTTQVNDKGIVISESGDFEGSPKSEHFFINASSNIIISGKGNVDIYTILPLPFFNLTITDFDPGYCVIDLTAYPAYESMSDLSITRGSVIIQLLPKPYDNHHDDDKVMMIRLLGLDPEDITSDNFLFASPEPPSHQLQQSSKSTSIGFSSNFVVAIVVFIMVIVLIFVGTGFYARYSRLKRLEDASLRDNAKPVTESNQFQQQLGINASFEFLVDYFGKSGDYEMVVSNEEDIMLIKSLWDQQMSSSSDVIIKALGEISKRKLFTRVVCYKLVCLISSSEISVRDGAFHALSNCLLHHPEVLADETIELLREYTKINSSIVYYVDTINCAKILLSAFDDNSDDDSNASESEDVDCSIKTFKPCDTLKSVSQDTCSINPDESYWYGIEADDVKDDPFDVMDDNETGCDWINNVINDYSGQITAAEEINEQVDQLLEEIDLSTNFGWINNVTNIFSVDNQETGEDSGYDQGT